MDEFIDNFDEGRHEEQFEEEIPHEVYVEEVPQDDFIDEEFMGEEVPHEVFVEDVPADEFVENQDYVDESIEDLEDPAYYDELADDVEPVEDLEDPAYYEELEESGEDLEVLFMLSRSLCTSMKSLSFLMKSLLKIVQMRFMLRASLSRKSLW